MEVGTGLGVMLQIIWGWAEWFSPGEGNTIFTKWLKILQQTIWLIFVRTRNCEPANVNAPRLTGSAAAAPFKHYWVTDELNERLATMKHFVCSELGFFCGIVEDSRTTVYAPIITWMWVWNARGNTTIEWFFFIIDDGPGCVRDRGDWFYVFNEWNFDVGICVFWEDSLEWYERGIDLTLMHHRLIIFPCLSPSVSFDPPPNISRSTPLRNLLTKDVSQNMKT